MLIADELWIIAFHFQMLSNEYKLNNYSMIDMMILRFEDNQF